MAAVEDGRILNVGPSPAREDDHTPEAAEAAGHLRAVDPPERADLRAPWYGIHDQGKTGSCVGWALADSVMWRQLVRAGKLLEEDRLSPRFMWMAAKEMRAKLTPVKGEPAWQPTTFLEQGMTDVKSALDVARTFGAALEEDLPFDGRLYPGRIGHFFESAAQRKITRYYRLDPGEDAQAWFLHWRRWIDQHGPVLIVVKVDQQFVDGKPKLEAFDPASASFNHAAALVGYAPGGFLMRCSWGEDWGQDGYAVVTESYLEASTLESYGVVV
ncbi:MAG TPA: C1 family peptidase [Solirubrobacteraceae bacterium]|nr:C1 family peptidase [Solirubrobacteraceae bacterium]